MGGSSGFVRVRFMLFSFGICSGKIREKYEQIITDGRVARKREK